MTAHAHSTDAPPPEVLLGLPARSRTSTLYAVTKRAIDVVGSVAALVIMALPMLITAILIKLESPGPAFYWHYRIGENGLPFRFYKFRSMVVNAHEARGELLTQNEAAGPIFKIRRDPRITRVGRWIRKTSLDETPQLLHVLQGKMSLVGPRPPLPEEVENYEPWQLERLSVRPGLTCIWQISGRSDIPFERWVELDIIYVRTRSLLLDLRILLLTPWAVISGRGAY